MDWFTCISGHPSAVGRAQDSESSPVKDQRSTAELRYQPSTHVRPCKHNISPGKAVMLTYKARRDTWYDCSVLLVCLMDERSALTVPTMLGIDPCQTLHNRQPRAFPVALDNMPPPPGDRRPISGQFVVRGKELPTAYVRTKFEGRSSPFAKYWHISLRCTN